MSEVAQTEGIHALWKAPEIPSKYDIIPIHNSDRGSFRRCRRYFDWSSPTRSNLSLRADLMGINTDLFFGTGIHWALEQYYTPGLRHDPVESWKTWFSIQWQGGLVGEEGLDRVYDLEPKPSVSQQEFTALQAGEDIKPSLWIVRGLEDILPDPDGYVYDELYNLGVAMMEGYKLIAAKNDGFEVLVAEHDFSIPIWDYENDCILKAVDLREQSPNYGNVLEVHNRGRMDAIYVKPNGKIGILDHKTSSRIDEEFFIKLETDEQCTSYLYAGEVEAKFYNLPYAGEPMEEVIYNVLRKAAPKEPTMVRGGLFSVNRNEESATYEMLSAFMQEHGIVYDELPEKHKGYIAWLRDVGDEQFYVRKLVRRNKAQLRNAGFRLYLESMDMLDDKLRIYPNLSNSYKCLRCAFRAPCLAKEAGYDYEDMIRNNYTRTRDR